MQKILKWIPLICIMAFSLILRLSLIAKGAYNIDSLQMALLAEKAIDTGQLQYQYGTGYPLTILLGSIFIYMGRLISIFDPAICFNFMSVFFSTLSVFVFYMIADHLFNRRTAILAAALFSVNPIFLDISLYGMSHAPSLFFILLAIYYYLLADKKENRNKIYLSALFLGLAGAVRLQEMGMVLIALLFHNLYSATKDEAPLPLIKHVKILAAYCSITFFTTICFHLPYLLTDIRQEYLAQLGHYSQSSFSLGANLSAFPRFSEKILFILDNIVNHTTYYIIEGLTLMGFLCALAGMFFLWRDKKDICLLLFLWIIIPVIIFGLQMTSSARFLTFIMPPLYIFMAYLFSRVFTQSPAFRVVFALIFCCILTLSITQNFPFFIARHQSDTIKDYALWIKKTTEPNALVINSDEGLFVEYYGRRGHLGRPLGYTFIKEKDLAAFRTQLDQLLSKEIPVYITSNALHVYDPQNQFADMIQNNYQLKTAGSHFCEYWHRAPFEQLLFYVTLYRITR